MKLQERTSLREIIIIGISIIAIFLVIFLIVMKTQYKSYSKILNDKINITISQVVEKYPEVKEEDILKIVNSNGEPEENILQKYGYDDDVANIKEIKTEMENNITKNLVIVALFGVVSLITYTMYILVQEKNLKRLMII